MQVLNGVCAIMAIQKVCPQPHLCKLDMIAPHCVWRQIWQESCVASSLTAVAVAVWPWDSTDHLQRFKHLCGLHLGRYIPTLKDTVCDDGQH